MEVDGTHFFRGIRGLSTGHAIYFHDCVKECSLPAWVCGLPRTSNSANFCRTWAGVIGEKADVWHRWKIYTRFRASLEVLSRRDSLGCRLETFSFLYKDISGTNQIYPLTNTWLRGWHDHLEFNDFPLQTRGELHCSHVMCLWEWRTGAFLNRSIVRTGSAHVLRPATMFAGLMGRLDGAERKRTSSIYIYN